MARNTLSLRTFGRDVPTAAPDRPRRAGAGTRERSAEHHGAVLLAVLTAGALLVGFDDPRLVVGMVLLGVTLALLRLRAHLEHAPARERRVR
jgi:hypothetical protein